MAHRQNNYPSAVLC